MRRKQAKKLHDKLEKAIKDVEALLPKEAKTTTTIKQHRWGGMEEIGCVLNGCSDDHMEEVEEVAYPALQPIYALLESLKKESR
jgi:hypothetical protein